MPTAVTRTIWQRLFRLAFWLGVAGLVLVSLTPGNALPRIPYDLLYHGASYTGLALLAVLGYAGARERWIAFAGLVVLGAVLELAQQFVPGRAGSMADVLANATGVALVGLFWITVRRAGRKNDRAVK